MHCLIKNSLLAFATIGLSSMVVMAQTDDKTQNVNVNLKVGESSGTKERVTVITPRPDGGSQIVTQEVTTEGDGSNKSRRTAPVAATDDTPRKARVVVVPAIFAGNMRTKVNREFNERFGIVDPTIIENPGYTSYLIDALVNSRKLEVLERDDLRSLTKEIDFGESEYADVNKAVKLGQMLNADFVVIPQIRDFVVVTERRNVPYVGGTQEKLKGRLATTVRTVNVASGKIIASHLYEVDKYSRVRERDTPRIVVSDLISAMYSESSLKEAANLIDVAYPIKIMSINGDNVIVNRGRGAVIEGEILKVYETGEVMIDPDTKENLGFNEAYAGSIKITEVNEKISKGVIIEQKGTIERLSICRRENKPKLENKANQEPPAPKLD